MNRRTFLGLAGAAAVTPGLAVAADMRKQIKITGLETDVLRFPPGQIFCDAIRPSAGISVKFHDKLSFPTATTVRGIYLRLDCGTSLLPRSRRVQVKLFR